jgi:uncharacterized protein YegP (UPF0339 family)
MDSCPAHDAPRSHHTRESAMTQFLRSLALMTALGVTVAATGTMAQEKKEKKPADTKKADDKEEKIGKVEIYEVKDGFRFRILGADGKSIGMASRSYKTKDDCSKAYDELKAIVAKVKPVEVTK